MAAFPVALERREYDELPQMYKERFPRLLRERNMLNLSGIRSGGNVDGFYMVLLDQYGGVVTSSNSHSLTFSIENKHEAAYTPKV